MKKKFLKAKQEEFITKELNKTIMTRSWLRNKYLKEKSADSNIAYDKEITVWISYLGPKRIILVKSTSTL